jgi:hypothetical protein
MDESRGHGRSVLELKVKRDGNTTAILKDSYVDELAVCIEFYIDGFERGPMQIIGMGGTSHSKCSRRGHVEKNINLLSATRSQKPTDVIIDVGGTLNYNRRCQEGPEPVKVGPRNSLQSR